MLLRLPYLTVSSVFAFIRLLPMRAVDRDIEILTLRHQLAVLQRQINRPRVTPADRAFLAALLHQLPRPKLRQLHLIVSPDTVLRWHRDLMRRRHAEASRRKQSGRPPARRSIQALVLRLARENSSWGYRRIHGELAVLGIKVAPSTVWEILRAHGIEPAPERKRQTWAAFLRGQAHAILACDFFTATTLNGATLYVFAVIEHANRRIRILGATAHPTADWVTQTARNVVMDLQDAGATVRYLIRDRDSKFTGAFDAVFEAEGIEIVTTGIRVPRMNSIMERWVQTCRHELLDRTLILNQAHLLHALGEFESIYNQHRPHRALHSAAPLRPLREPITEPDRLDHLDIRRRDRLGGLFHEYAHAA
ncbi:integrase core domain-containing protein [Streptomyces sp. NBC_01728]|uniref:integrase core domain-containing protein n=2 Tax=Streptomyces TaxID=1883 RepID=UPI00224FDB3A|nr:MULTISPECIES: integrase core domain-containing protein [unclassified Streptomyces]MCX4461408.1 integrase core domain-containing protein [Streptomyces sp. NBC_01719]MCX4490316.1 integrase core domain-containing protein [Streptomyces sp. NBC_01728]MCX4597112.1 integrase core domain-containing protein [Streptomyces sp. NBC_01549]